MLSGGMLTKPFRITFKIGRQQVQRVSWTIGVVTATPASSLQINAMSIEQEAISVIFRCAAVEKRVARGMNSLAEITRSRLRTDGEIAAVSFMNDLDAILFSERLKELGLRPGRDMLSYGWNDKSPKVTWLTLDQGRFRLRRRASKGSPRSE
jgi:hypothetical protein